MFPVYQNRSSEKEHSIGVVPTEKKNLSLNQIFQSYPLPPPQKESLNYTFLVEFLIFFPDFIKIFEFCRETKKGYLC